MHRSAYSEISAIIPTWRRPDTLRRALLEILSCDPSPPEVLVHIDASDDQTPPMLDRDFKVRVAWFQSTTTQGPGGGRNLLIQRARHPLVASFDDDSWPIDRDYFAVAAGLLAEHEAAAVLTGSVTVPGQTVGARICRVS